MKKLKKIEHVVENILEVNEDARKNDDILYLNVCKDFCEDVPSMTLKEFLETRNELACPNFASVTRARRKVFEKRPELKPEKVTELRKGMENVYEAYALSS